jgi:hypothetical protein
MPICAYCGPCLSNTNYEATISSMVTFSIDAIRYLTIRQRYAVLIDVLLLQVVTQLVPIVYS